MSFLVTSNINEVLIGHFLEIRAIILCFAGHPWIRNYNDVKVPLDILIFKLMKTYMRSSSLRKAALRVRILVS